MVSRERSVHASHLMSYNLKLINDFQLASDGGPPFWSLGGVAERKSHNQPIARTRFPLVFCIYFSTEPFTLYKHF